MGQYNIHVCQDNPMYHISDIIYTVCCWLVILSCDIFKQTKKKTIWVHSLIHLYMHFTRQKWSKMKVERGVTPYKTESENSFFHTTPTTTYAWHKQWNLYVLQFTFYLILGCKTFLQQCLDSENERSRPCQKSSSESCLSSNERGRETTEWRPSICRHCCGIFTYKIRQGTPKTFVDKCI